MIKGKLVGLRGVEKEDLPILKDWRNIAEFRKNFREIRELNSYNQKVFYEKLCIKNKDNYMFTIVRLEDNAPIGACGLLYLDWVIRSADFSFYIGDNKEYIDKKGYSQEAATLLIEYGFDTLNLHKIWMELYEFDKKKIDFFTKIFNFKIDGTLRDNTYCDGKYYNSHMLSLIKNDIK